MQRYRPIGWKYESYRHSLAARGIRTRGAFALKKYPMPGGQLTRVEVTPGEVGFGAEFPEGTVMRYIKGGDIDAFTTGEAIATREPSPFNEEEYIQYHMNNPRSLSIIPEDVKVDPILLRSFIEDARQADMAELLKKEEEGYYGTTSGVVAPVEGFMRPTQYGRGGKTIPKLTAGVGSDIPVLVTKEVFNRMSLQERDDYVKRMFQEIGGKDLADIVTRRHPGDEFRMLPSTVKESYINQLFAKDAENERIAEIAEQRELNISGLSAGELTRGKFPYAGESAALRRKAESEKEFETLLEKGGDISDKSLFRIADKIHPKILDETRALDLRRAAKAEELRIINLLDKGLKSGDLSQEDYDKVMVKIQGISKDVERKTDKVLNEVQASKMETKKILEAAVKGKGDPIVRAINAKIPLLRKMMDNEFFQESTKLKSVLTGDNIGSQGIGSKFAISSIPYPVRQDLLNKIIYEEEQRKILMAKQQGRRVRSDDPLARLKAQAEAGERIKAGDILAMMRRLERLGR